VASKVRRPAALWLATWGPCGYSPLAPGTAGALGGVAVAWLLRGPAGWPAWSLAVMVAVLLWPSVGSSAQACGYWQSKDPQAVVVDEVLGVWVTLAAAPALDWRYWVAGFALFRLFDIWKPFPIRAAERLPGGWGIVVDDLVAGLYGAVVLALWRWLHF
jgi:phosphatidylglycerophosphatase A